METNQKLELARKYVEQTNKNIFLTGKAGTGKTTFLKNLVKTLKKRHVVLAPTGVAALNAEGQTIHSFLQLDFDPYIPGHKLNLSDLGGQNLTSFAVWTLSLLTKSQW